MVELLDIFYIFIGAFLGWIISYYFSSKSSNELSESNNELKSYISKLETKSNMLLESSGNITKLLNKSLYFSPKGLQNPERNKIEEEVKNEIRNIDKNIKDFKKLLRNSPVVKTVMKRANNHCELCNKSGSGLTFHHIQPLRFGGDNSIYNLVALCPRCNTRLASSSKDCEENIKLKDKINNYHNL